jgi:hypothetical protein
MHAKVHGSFRKIKPQRLLRLTLGNIMFVSYPYMVHPNMINEGRKNVSLHSYADIGNDFPSRD